MDEIIKTHNIWNRIITIRGLMVMIDRDLAEFYGIPTKRLNEQVRRNLNQFPKTFRFDLRQPRGLSFSKLKMEAKEIIGNYKNRKTLM